MKPSNIYPFKFLDSYTKEDKDIFFGRDAEIQALYEMVFQTDLLLVYGASGTGKTSLIQCGLASRFQSHDWLALNIRRGHDINTSFERVLQEAGGTTEEDNNLDWLDTDWEKGIKNESSKEISPLARRFKAIYLRHFRPIYLIFDQFEELYILGSKEEQATFVQTVKELLKVEQPVKIVISIREEYLGYLYEFEKAVPELLRKKLRIEPMNLDKVKSIMMGIHHLQGSNVHLQAGEEQDVAEGIFDKIRGDEKTLTIQLPYLQVFLDKLYLKTTNDQDRIAEAIFSINTLQQLGTIGDVLRDFLDEQVETIARNFQQAPETIWKILSPFVTLEGTKEPIAAQTLLGRLSELPTNLVQNTLQTLVDRRILRRDEKEEVFEIVHDSLAKQIHAKRTDEEIALLEVQRLIKSQTALNEEAREYFSEKQLQLIEPYLPKLGLAPAELNWIDRSRAYIAQQKAAESQRQKEELARARKRTTVAVIFSVFSIAIAILAFWQFKEAQAAQRIAQSSVDALQKEKAFSIAREQINYGDGFWGLGDMENAKNSYQKGLDAIIAYPNDTLYKTLEHKIQICE